MEIPAIRDKLIAELQSKYNVSVIFLTVFANDFIFFLIFFILFIMSKLSYYFLVVDIKNWQKIMVFLVLNYGNFLFYFEANFFRPKYMQ